MNQLTPYEQLLAQEMEQLPLPSRVDSIWTDIQVNLDAGNIPSPRSHQPRLRRVGIHWRILVITAAIIGAIVLFKHQQKSSTKGKIPVTPQEQKLSPDSIQKKEPGQEHKEQRAKPSLRVPFKHDSFPMIKQDSSFISPSPVVLPPAENKINPPLISFPPPKDSSKTTKKGRGVNLDDSDYKIISHRKDSGG